MTACPAMQTIAAYAVLAVIAAGWLYLAFDAHVNGDPFTWAWRKVSRRRTGC
jgi:hypothetical protein